MELRPYQEEAINAIHNEWKQGNKKTLLVLATGLGKTVCFATVAAEQYKKGRKQLFLAHREELIFQGVEEIKNVSGLEPDIILGDRTTATPSSKMVFASVASLSRKKRLEQYPENYFDDIYIDECHHSTADTYQTILSRFPDANILGVTATPNRMDHKKISEFFDSTAYEYDIIDGIKDGWLSDITIKTIPVKIDISDVRVQAGDYLASDLGNTLEAYLDTIADKIVTECVGRKTVIFLPLVSVSQRMTEILRKKGLKAAEVNAKTENREEIINKFRTGKYDILCNALLLTEGWNCPEVSCIIMLRPTKSDTLFRQAIGRGTRLCEGKTDLLILDFLWLTKKHDLFNAISMVASTDAVSYRMSDKLRTGKAFNLIDLCQNVERDIEEEKRQQLLEELEHQQNKHEAVTRITGGKVSSYYMRNKKWYRDESYLQSALSKLFDNHHILNYEPVYKWECLEMTPGQSAALTSFLKSDIKYVHSRGLAAFLLSFFITRRQAGLCTYRQAVYLVSLQPGTQCRNLTFNEASALINKYSGKELKPSSTQSSSSQSSSTRSAYKPSQSNRKRTDSSTDYFGPKEKKKTSKKKSKKKTSGKSSKTKQNEKKEQKKNPPQKPEKSNKAEINNQMSFDDLPW